MNMKTRELRTELKNFKEIRRYILDVLKSNNVSGSALSETLLVFEALYNDMLAQGVPEDAVLKVRGISTFGELKIRIGFEGSVYVPSSDQQDDMSADNVVMRTYGEKIEHAYHSGYNNISITVRRNFEKTIALCMFAIVAAILCYALLSRFMDHQQQLALLDDLVFPLEKLFANAMMMVGAPVTFFSLLRNLTDSYIISEKESDIRRIQYRTLASSVAAVVMAVGMSMFIYEIIKAFAGGEVGELDMSVKASLAEIIESIVPHSIFETFEVSAPFPLIVFAILVTYALCSAGRYFNGMRNVIDACYTLFSKMLSAVMFSLPLFFFLAVLDLLLDTGAAWLVNVILIIAMVYLSLSVLALFYAIRLKVSGVRLGSFVRTLMPLIRENLKINSSIDAVPFNIRYCTTKFGFDRKKLEVSLPVLAQLNLDGNCYLITLIALLTMYVNGVSASWFDIIVIGIVVLFLSMGAPNQPGSIVIGLLIVFNYLGAQDFITVAIYSEVLAGNVLTLTNTIGDIVTVAAEDAVQKKAAAQE